MPRTATTVFILYALAEAALDLIATSIVFTLGMGMSYQSAGSCLFAAGTFAVVAGMPGAVAGIVLFRRYRARWTIALGPLPFALAVLAAIAGLAFDDVQAIVTRHVLARSLTIGGRMLPAGTTVAEKGRDLLIVLPPGGTFAGEPVSGTFRADAQLLSVPDNLPLGLASDATVHGLRCLAGRPFTFVAGLPSCVPPPPGIVNGVPCSTHLAATVVQPFDYRFKAFGVKCELGDAYRSHGIIWPAGTAVDTAPDHARYVTKRRLPGLLLLGRPLPPGTAFDFDETGSPFLTISSPSTFGFRGCAIARLRIVHRTGSPAATCADVAVEEAGTNALTFDGKPVDW